ncbi:MAG: B12-binding domain-containing radical SAM protein [Proteobacteria bacterium]|nr:B12-binding domain-containing radical SAM protein [Pseudomonadota bacterium]MBU1715839.1 B12-binding domain-containing radical SAM protein [Pseudomonadota bacterium]
MNVLLLYPEFPDTFWSFKHALKFIHKKSQSPPLGLLTIAAMLPLDWEKRLVDLNISNLTDHDLVWADCALISAMAVQRESAQYLIDCCKNAGLTIIAGGPLFTYEHEQFCEVDHFVLNEGELTLPPFLEDFQAGRARRVYQTTEFADISQTPVPMWELLDLKYYASMSIQFSRGCPFQCEFCNVTALLGHKIRTKTTRQIIAELDALYAEKWRSSVFFVDDNFICNKTYLKNDLLPALIEWRQDKPRITFFTEASINLADDDQLMWLMAEAGFYSVFIGIETPDEESLIECSKKQNQNRDLLEDVKRIHRAGLQVQGGFIVGFDNDTAAIFQKQIDFIQKSGIVTAMVGLLQALPGTRLYKRLQLEERLLGGISGNNVAAETNIVPTMGLDALQEGYKAILCHIYSSEYYYKRVKTFLKEYNPPKIKTRLSFQHKMAFFRASLYLGIIGKDRVQYWRLIWWTQFHRPRLVPQAVTLAIYGYHFAKVCKLTIL